MARRGLRRRPSRWCRRAASTWRCSRRAITTRAAAATRASRYAGAGTTHAPARASLARPKHPRAPAAT
eukprot:1562169-Prymnesium_polylepis.1